MGNDWKSLDDQIIIGIKLKTKEILAKIVLAPARVPIEVLSGEWPGGIADTNVDNKLIKFSEISS